MVVAVDVFDWDVPERFVLGLSNLFGFGKLTKCFREVDSHLIIFMNFKILL